MTTATSGTTIIHSSCLGDGFMGLSSGYTNADIITRQEIGWIFGS